MKTLVLLALYGVSETEGAACETDADCETLANLFCADTIVDGYSYVGTNCIQRQRCNETGPYGWWSGYWLRCHGGVTPEPGADGAACTWSADCDADQGLACGVYSRRGEVRTSICVPASFCGTSGFATDTDGADMEIECPLLADEACGGGTPSGFCDQGLDCINTMTCTNCEQLVKNASFCVATDVCEDLGSLWFEYTN